jgi:programmed cell death 6-interacting protein
LAGTSAPVVAKLAMGAGNAYAAALRSLNDFSHLKTWLGKSQYPWEKHILFQHLCFMGAAFYWQSKSFNSAEEWGKEIAELQRAVKHVEFTRTCDEDIRKLNATLVGNRDQLAMVVATRLKAAMHDNETSYFVSVPKELPDVEATMMAKLTPFALTQPDATFDEFKQLVAPEIRETASQFELKVADTVNRAAASAQEATNMAKMHLNSLNLPAAIDALNTAQGMPEELVKSIKALQYKGGLKSIAGLFQNVTLAAKEAAARAHEVSDILLREKGDDVSMRAQFGLRWVRKSSDEITASFMQSIEMIEKYLSDAEKSNQAIHQEWKTNEDVLAELSKDRAALEQEIPTVAPAAQSQSAQTLRSLLATINNLVGERQKCVDALKAAADPAKLNLVALLLQDAKSKTKEQTLAAVMSDVLEPHLKKLAQLDTDQTKLLDQVNLANEEFVTTRKQDDQVTKRERVLQRLNVGVTLAEKLMDNLNEGIRFYNELVVDQIEPLKLRVGDFAVAREIEKRMLLDQLTKSLANFSIGVPSSSSSSSSSAAAGGEFKNDGSASGGAAAGAGAGAGYWRSSRISSSNLRSCNNNSSNSKHC